MSNFSVDVYNSLTEFETALESVDDINDVIFVPYKDGVQTKVVVLTGTDQIGNSVNTDLNAVSVIEQAPLDQQVLNEKVENVITSTSSSTWVSCGDKQGLTVCVIADGTVSATLKVQGSPDGINPSDLGVIDSAGDVSTSISLTAEGTYFYSVVNASTLPYIRSNITITTGTYSIYVFGRGN